MKIIVLICLAWPFILNGSTLEINNNGSTEISSAPVIMNCSGMTVDLTNTTECCAGNSCQSHDPLLLSKPNHTTCPKLVVDSYIYDVSSDIQIFNTSKLISITNSSIDSCQRPGGGFPTLGSGFILASGAVAVGVESMYINEADWTMNITSVDGNLTCQGGQIYSFDLIFKNGFEQE